MTLVPISHNHYDISPVLATISVLCSANTWLEANMHSCCHCKQTMLSTALCCFALCVVTCCALPNLEYLADSHPVAVACSDAETGLARVA